MMQTITNVSKRPHEISVRKHNRSEKVDAYGTPPGGGGTIFLPPGGKIEVSDEDAEKIRKLPCAQPGGPRSSSPGIPEIVVGDVPIQDTRPIKVTSLPENQALAIIAVEGNPERLQRWSNEEGISSTLLQALVKRSKELSRR